MNNSLVGQTIAHYEVLDLLGGGGMGVVYKARDIRLRRTVALKFLPPDLTRDPEAVARFKREAQAASALDHKNICTIFAIEEPSEGGIFIAMACYEGQTLKERLEGERLSLTEAFDFALQTAEGLARAHDAGITHRDIKPANLLITTDGEVKILDFGLAKVAGESQLTQSGSTLGTVAYMSPEQARGDDVDPRTDVWSLGVVLYEMLTGRRPFLGAYPPAVIYSILNEDPPPLRDVNPEIDPELETIMLRALEKNVDRRYHSAGEMLQALRSYHDATTSRAGTFDIRRLVRAARSPKVAVPALIALVAAGFLGSWIFQRQSRIRWATQVALPQIEQLVSTGWRDFTDAYELAEEAEKYIPNDPKLVELLSRSSLHIDIDSDPPGADVYVKRYDVPESEWRHVGVTPLDSVRVPMGVFRWRMEKEGYEPVEAAAATWDIDISFDNPIVASSLMRVLDPAGSTPAGMVRVQGASTPYGEFPDFYIDRYEVTNAQFKEFVDSGGYRSREYWPFEFVRDGEIVSWEEAMALFVDETGRPGPSTWQAGTYREGTGDHPVSGVSWYEAAAYAAWAGKSLPTGQHWGLARGEHTSMIRWPQLGGYAIFAPFSNFGEEGPVPVGSLPGMTSFGAYDMAGNVREWCWNETPLGRMLRGGAWNDNTYRFTQPTQAPPFDRSATNGFRTALYPDPEKVPEAAFGPVQFVEGRNFYEEEPVSDEVFEVYRAQFDYDDLPLNAELEARDESAEDWIHERISVDAAYGGERLILHLFLPTNTGPPFQTVVYFPGSASLFQTSSENITEYYEFPIFLSFLLKGGRAVVYPVYKGTFERQELMAAQAHVGDESYRHVEYVIQWVKDVRRTLDYLETRHDIDSDRFAFYGMSWGGMYGAIIPAVENRLKVNILAPGALRSWRTRPEADQINYVTRVTIPTLMLNGRYDARMPLETSIQPLYDLLGTSPEHKVLKLYDTDHIPPRSEYIKEILAWLDKYLGPVN